MAKSKILRGDCRAVMRKLAPNSVDSIVTDPPYELGFMGKGWDRSGVANDVETWAEALRVLKPGGHLLAFSGSRTYHRMVCAIEDAGFEIRDQIMWLYGSGFPKSLDVSKAIDKRGGNANLTVQIGAAIKAAREARGLTKRECDERYCGGTTNWTWFEGRPVGQRVPTSETFAAIAKDWPELAPLADAVAKVEREVAGTVTGSLLAVAPGQGSDRSATSLNITAPATDAARQWSGWGTALKPAHEPIVVARKPLIGTVAANVQAHGTGALNIDGCRVAGAKGTGNWKGKGAAEPGFSGGWKSVETDQSALGRWPANVIHDGSDEVLEAFAAFGSKGAAAPVKGTEPSDQVVNVYGARARVAGAFHGDTGSAARFFYCAKASRADRNAGLEGREEKPLLWSAGTKNPGSFQSEGTKKAAANNHPTVKPTELMRYLCRLVTPPGGLVLDPFMGSGSTGRGAALEGFRFVGIELSDEYAGIAAARIKDAA